MRKLFIILFRFSLVAATLFIVPSQAFPSTARKAIEPGLTAEIKNGNDIYLSACSTSEYDLSDWASRMLANPENQARFTSGRCLKVPLGELTEEYQLEVIRALFKMDAHDESGWIHRVTYVSRGKKRGETLWSMSKWFTGDPQNYKKIQAHNGMGNRTQIYEREKIKIPLAILRPAFKEPILFETAVRRIAESASTELKQLNGDLVLKTDSQGPYASYGVRKGDTIYTKVVLKYTDRVDAEDVLEAVKIIGRRSGIKNPDRLKPGQEVKLPLELLSPMYLPRSLPRREEYERLMREAEKYSNPVRTAELKNIIVILDPGHGGNDPGALGAKGVYEDEIAYDITCRIKRLLDTTTMAKVIPTLIDKSQQYEPRDISRFPKDTDEYVLTHPAYKNHDARVSANLRWYLANSIFRKMTAQGADPDKVVFVSIHADSLHYKARGTMIYIPGTYYCRGNGRKDGPVYVSRAEVNEQQSVTISYKDRVRSEGLSRDLAKHVIDSLSEHDIVVHAEKPIRNHVIRRRRAYVPAVIRHNIVPTKILIEVGNMKNSIDHKLITDYKFRERFAQAFVHALKQYYGGK